LCLGCTFLVNFHDAPGCDGGDCSGGDSGAGGPCVGRAGDFCGNDNLNGYQGAPSDLVSCAGDAVIRVRACEAGAGCLTVPALPDTCDDCRAKGVGSFCGREFKSFPPDDSDVLVTCSDAGAATGVVVCPSVCRAGAGDASCQSF